MGKVGEDKSFERTKSVMCLFLSNSVLIHEIVSFRVAVLVMTARVIISEKKIRERIKRDK